MEVLRQKSKRNTNLNPQIRAGELSVAEHRPPSSVPSIHNSSRKKAEDTKSTTQSEGSSVLHTASLLL